MGVSTSALLVSLATSLGAQTSTPPDSADEALRAIVTAGTRLPFESVPISVTPPAPQSGELLVGPGPTHVP